MCNQHKSHPRCKTRNLSRVAMLLVILHIVVSYHAVALAEDAKGPSPAPSNSILSETITLDQAVALAIRHNYRLNVSREELLRTQKCINAARTEGLHHRFQVLRQDVCYRQDI